MQSRRHPAVQVFMAVGLVSLLVGCAPGKRAQCNSLATSVNNGTALGKKLEGFGNDLGTKFRSAKNIKEFQAVAKESATQIGAMVGEVEQFGKTVGAVDLKDTTLVGFRDRAVANYGTTATTLKQMQGLFQEMSTMELSPANAEKMKTKMQALQEISVKMNGVDAAEKKVSSEFNTYCEVTPAAK
jgi:hypothetical protein